MESPPTGNANAERQGQQQGGAGPATVWGRLEVPGAKGVEYLTLESVAALHAEGSYTDIHCVNGAHYLVSSNIHRLERSLPPNLFFRCHRSHVINLVKVLRLDRENGYRAFLTGDIHVAVSRRCWSALREAMLTIGR